MIKNDRYESNEIDYTCHFLLQKVILNIPKSHLIHMIYEDIVL
jgi:hypothetical protein